MEGGQWKQMVIVTANRHSSTQEQSAVIHNAQSTVQNFTEL